MENKDMKLLEGKEAKTFFNRAVNELEKDKLNQRFLKTKCGGYWKNEIGENWSAFDNLSGDLFIEEFDCEEEAIKYAKGIEAKTAGGFYI